MRRLAITAVALVLATTLISACGSDDDTSSDGDVTTSSTDHGTRGVLVAGRSFAYDPSEIRAKPGENLAIVLTSEDVLHDFVIDELDVYIAADVGTTKVKGLKVDKAGRYVYYCSLPGHRAGGMEGILIVE